MTKKNNDPQIPMLAQPLPSNYAITSFEQKSNYNILVLNGAIEECTDMVSTLLKLNPQDPLNFIINSPGGYVNEGILLFNILQDFPYLTTIVNGSACSMGAILAMASESRYITPFSEMMIHNASTTEFGNVSAIGNSISNIKKRMSGLITKLFKKYLTKKELYAILEENKDLWLDYDEVIRRGIALPYREEIKKKERKKKDEQEDRCENCD